MNPEKKSRYFVLKAPRSTWIDELTVKLQFTAGKCFDTIPEIQSFLCR